MGMSSERNLLAACFKERAAYEMCEKWGVQSTLTEHGKKLYDGIKEYYDRDDLAERVDPELLQGLVTAGLGNPKHKEFFSELVKAVAETEVSAPNVVSLVASQNREVAAGKLASALAAGRKGDEVDSLIVEYQKWSEGTVSTEESSVLEAPSLGNIVEERKGNRSPIMPRALNEAIRGGALPGHHVVVFARPETGKTLFMLNATASFLKNGKTVLYVGNEDPAEDIICRLVGRITGMRTEEVERDPARADKLARDAGYDNFIYAGLAPGTLGEIEQLVKEYEPDVLIVDQVRNLSVGGSENNYTIKLEAASKGIRDIAKKYQLVAISVTQAGDSATGKSVLDMGDVDFSNTGIPATADLMIGIGASRDDVSANRLILSLCKNKIGGKHSIVPVIVDYSLGKLISQA